jgi:hypothetical protein
MPVRRGTVPTHRNLLARPPERRHDELSAGDKDMICAGAKPEIATKRQAFVASGG